MRERSKAALSERDRRALDDITDEVERLRRLTEDLVDLSADRPLMTATISLADLLAETARATEAMFPGITVRFQGDELPSLDVDAVRLRQVFANLLSNAAQAQREGEIVVRTAVAGGAMRVRVQDKGPGISREVGERIFDLYFTAKSGGTGLGLAIARRFVERHGGTLTHVADESPGTTFEVRLPLAPPDGAASKGG
jgi:two-component system sensor histidine kinase BaeS